MQSCPGWKLTIHCRLQWTGATTVEQRRTQLDRVGRRLLHATARASACTTPFGPKSHILERLATFPVCGDLRSQLLLLRGLQNGPNGLLPLAAAAVAGAQAVKMLSTSVALPNPQSDSDPFIKYVNMAAATDEANRQRLWPGQRRQHDCRSGGPNGHGDAGADALDAMRAMAYMAPAKSSCTHAAASEADAVQAMHALACMAPSQSHAANRQALSAGAQPAGASVEESVSAMRAYAALASPSVGNREGGVHAQGAPSQLLDSLALYAKL